MLDLASIISQLSDGSASVTTMGEAASLLLRTLKPKSAAKPRQNGAVAFWETHSAAVTKIQAEYGEHWHVTAPHGRTELVSLPAGLRSYKAPGGGTVRYMRDHRIPAATFWPSGKLPDGLAIEPDPLRDPGDGTARASDWVERWQADHAWIGEVVAEQRKRDQKARERQAARTVPTPTWRAQHVRLLADAEQYRGQRWAGAAFRREILRARALRLCSEAPAPERLAA